MKGPVQKEIEALICEIGLKAGTVKVSLSKDAVLEEFESGSFAMMRWLCWSINDKDGNEIVVPRFEVCRPDLTVEEIREDFGRNLLGLEILIDHDIVV